MLWSEFQVLRHYACHRADERISLIQAENYNQSGSLESLFPSLYQERIFPRISEAGHLCYDGCSREEFSSLKGKRIPYENAFVFGTPG